MRTELRVVDVLVVAAIIFMGFLLRSTVYMVDVDEVAVVQRFGKFNRIEEPGLRFKLPDPIEKKSKVKTRFQFKEEFGFRTVRPGIRTAYTKSSGSESLVLTGDLNVIDLEWVLQYKKINPVKYLFKVRNPDGTVRVLAESVMRSVVGDYSFNEVLTTKRDEISEKVREELQGLFDDYDMGIKIDRVLLQDVNPPEPVKMAFNEVNAAKQEKERLLNEAKKEYNEKIPQARGEALKQIQNAEGYALEIINKAQGDVQRFNANLAAYNKNKEVVQQILYFNAFQEVLSGGKNKILIDKSLPSFLPLLDIGKSDLLAGERGSDVR